MKIKKYRFKLKINKKRIFVLVFIASIISLLLYFAAFDRDIFVDNASTTFYDQQGKPLRTLLSVEEQYSQVSQLSEVSPHFLRACVLIEDKNFYSHNGVVISSLIRALHQNIKGKRVVSGGSTITMQLAKLVYQHRNRNFFNKVSELFSALKFELHLSKSEILQYYVNRLPFGNMIYGIKEASRFYFGKAASQLSLNQAIYLALIPKSPSRYNPRKHLNLLKRRWIQILDLFVKRRFITRDEYERAKEEGIRFEMNRYPILAPHFIDLVKKKYDSNPTPSNVYTTLDYSIQQELEGIVKEHLVRLNKYRVASSAVVIIDNRTHEVVGFVGSPDYFNEDISGYVNLAVSLRQPGSTLKPFVYGLALENGYHPSSIIPDIRFPTKGGFFPKNHDGREHGPLRLRTALACSYNIPAFYLAMKLTPRRILKKLQAAGFTYISSRPGFYGETVALGSGEVKLLDLVIAYSAFANSGKILYPAFIKGEPVLSRELFDPRISFLIWNILSDPSARFASFGYNSAMNLPFPVAIKTGTSKGYRDKWAIGVNSLYTIGVWIGNPDGHNMKDLSGVGSAPTMLRDIFLAVQKDWTLGEIPMPEGIVKLAVCSLSGELVSGDCPDSIEEFFIEEQGPQRSCSYHIRDGGEVRVRYPEMYEAWAMKNNINHSLHFERDKKKWISFPQKGDFFYISNAISLKDQVITFEVRGFNPGERIQFLVDGQVYREIVFPETITWPLQRGDHTLSVLYNETTIDTIQFIVR
jgi:penicillin-binding protein 1C